MCTPGDQASTRTSTKGGGDNIERWALGVERWTFGPSPDGPVPLLPTLTPKKVDDNVAPIL
jgi:hypothetical protein